MEKFFQFLSGSTVDKLLMIFGLIFIALAVIGKLGNWINLKKAERTWSAFIGSLLLLFGMIIFFGLTASSLSPKSVSPETLCPEDEYIKEIVVVLVDRLDPLYPVQRAALKNYMINLKDTIPTYGKIVILYVKPNYNYYLEPAFVICNPGTGKEANRLIENPALIHKRWKDYASVFAKSIDEMIPSENTPQSPIMENIKLVAISIFENPKIKKIPKRLVLISDMIQNTSAHSQYRELVPFDKFSMTNYYQNLKTKLEGVEVEIIYVKRDYAESVQGAGHRKFWEKYFSEMGGVLTRFTAL